MKPAVYVLRVGLGSRTTLADRIFGIETGRTPLPMGWFRFLGAEEREDGPVLIDRTADFLEQNPSFAARVYGDRKAVAVCSIGAVLLAFRDGTLGVPERGHMTNGSLWLVRAGGDSHGGAFAAVLEALADGRVVDVVEGVAAREYGLSRHVAQVRDIVPGTWRALLWHPEGWEALVSLFERFCTRHTPEKRKGTLP